jgi:hypothetical protein
MNRKDFFRNLIRFMLLGLLSGIAVILGKKVITGTNCEVCPGSGICKGESDCSKFLSDIDGGK